MPATINDSSASGKEIALTYAVFFMPSLLSPGRASGSEYDSLEFTLAGILLVLPQILLLIHLIQNIGNRKPVMYGLSRPRAASLPPAVAVLLGILALLFGLEALRRGLAGFLPFSDPIRWRFRNYPLLPLTVLACALNAYREELYFRAYLLNEFPALGLGAGRALAASSLLFGLGHLQQGAWGALFAGLLGLYLGLCFYRTRDLHALAWAHAAYNLAVLLAGGLLFQ